MDVTPFNLVHFPETTIPKPAALVTLTADNVPSLQELRNIERALIAYKEKQEQRIKHSDEQLKVVNEQYAAMKERDGRDGNKVKQPKKELLDGLGPIQQRVAKPPPPPVRVSGPTAMTSAAQPSIPAATPTAKATARAGSVKLEPTSSKPNKKKRKRADELEDLINDGSSRTTPTTKGHGHKEHKSKKAKHDDHDLRMNPFGFRKVSDWSDSIKGGLPPRPPRNPLPIPQTDDPEEVNDDFAERKQPPNQVTAHAYWNYVEPWIRQIKEEDAAFLAFNNEDEELWEMPPLGRHYSEIWEDEDRYALGLPALNRPAGSRTHNPYAAFTDPPPPSAGGANAPPANAGLRWDPATLTDPDTITEEHGSGPLTERIFSSFMHLPNSGKMDEDDSYKGGPGLGRAAGQGTVGDLEERLMKECKALGLIREGEEPDYSQPQDDQIASELRRCQRALKAQMQINEARKRRLLSIAELRLSYADYEDVKEGMERNISNMFSKLGNVGAPKVTKKKKKEKEKVAAAAAVNPATGEPAGISGLGLVGMDGTLQIPPEIYEPVTVLRRWKSTVGARFEEIERENPGLVWGLPTKSIYEGLEEEIAEAQKNAVSSFAIGAPTTAGSSNSVNESGSGTSGGSGGDTSMAVDERQSSPEDVVMQST